jgi:hypothetical protein
VGFFLGYRFLNSLGLAYGFLGGGGDQDQHSNLRPLNYDSMLDFHNS